MCGISTEVKVQRQVAILFQRFQPKDENLNLEVIKTKSIFLLRQNPSPSKIEDAMIEGVPVRIYRPMEVIHNQDDAHPALIYFHGGAYHMGSVGQRNDWSSSAKIISLQTLITALLPPRLD